MKISSISIKNFRRLNQVSIDFSKDVTIFVGANNSGKTSAIEAMAKFLSIRQFSFYDFSVCHRSTINDIGQGWLTSLDEHFPDFEEWVNILPTMDVWLSVSDSDYHYIRDLIPTLEWDGQQIGVRLIYQPKDINKLFTEFREAKNSQEPVKELDLFPKNLCDFLNKFVKEDFQVQAYLLSDSKAEFDSDLKTNKANPLLDLIQVDVIAAQRGFYDADTSYRSQQNKLSDQLVRYYEKHLNPERSPSKEDIELIKTAIYAQKAFDDSLAQQFKKPIEDLQSLGYPGVHNPRLEVRSKIDTASMLNHDTAIQYALDNGSMGSELLPESYNGLGYQNLISLFFSLISFRDDWLHIGRASYSSGSIKPIHLVLIEEPEAHLHVQVQRVFVQQALKILQNSPILKDEDFSTQMVISTHSSDIAYEQDLSNLRYFKRIVASSSEMPVTDIRKIELSDIDEENLRFAKKYLKLIHYDIFFADAVILAEGTAEQILLPSMIKQNDELKTSYISVVSIGGRHANRFLKFLSFIGIPTLVITDVDPGYLNPERKRYLRENPKPDPKKDSKVVCTNPTINQWLDHHGKKKKYLPIEEVWNISDIEKVKGQVRIAYQLPITIGGERCYPATFEDAILYSNWNNLIEETGLPEASELLSCIEDLRDKGGKIDSPVDAYELLEDLDKTAFALDLLIGYDDLKIHAPAYIEIGLQWLASKLKVQSQNN